MNSPYKHVNEKCVCHEFSEIPLNLSDLVSPLALICILIGNQFILDWLREV